MTTDLEDGTTQSDAHKVEVVATKLLQSQQTLLPASSEQQVCHDSNFPTSQRCVKAQQGTGFMHQQRSATSGPWSIDYLAKIPQSEGDTVIPNNGDYFTSAHIVQKLITAAFVAKKGENSRGIQTFHWFFKKGWQECRRRTGKKL
jgi:hypothetical protein